MSTNGLCLHHRCGLYKGRRSRAYLRWGLRVAEAPYVLNPYAPEGLQSVEPRKTWQARDDVQT